MRPLKTRKMTLLSNKMALLKRATKSNHLRGSRTSWTGKRWRRGRRLVRCTTSHLQTSIWTMWTFCQLTRHPLNNLITPRRWRKNSKKGRSSLSSRRLNCRIFSNSKNFSRGCKRSGQNKMASRKMRDRANSSTRSTKKTWRGSLSCRRASMSWSARRNTFSRRTNQKPSKTQRPLMVTIHHSMRT